MKKFINDKRIDNTWAVIKLSELPDDMPVIGVSEYHDKSFAEFHLVEYCLIPKSLLNRVGTVQESDTTVDAQ